jgi:hypothetical protein
LSRALAVAAQAGLRRDYASVVRRLVRDQGLGWCLLAFAGHLALTTVLVGGLSQLGVPAILAKAISQLVGYLATFRLVDRVLLTRVRPRRDRLRSTTSASRV